MHPSIAAPISLVGSRPRCNPASRSWSIGLDCGRDASQHRIATVIYPARCIMAAIGLVGSRMRHISTSRSQSVRSDRDQIPIKIWPYRGHDASWCRDCDRSGRITIEFWPKSDPNVLVTPRCLTTAIWSDFDSDLTRIRSTTGDVERRQRRRVGSSSRCSGVWPLDSVRDLAETRPRSDLNPTTIWLDFGRRRPKFNHISIVIWPQFDGADTLRIQRLSYSSNHHRCRKNPIYIYIYSKWECTVSRVRALARTPRTPPPSPLDIIDNRLESESDQFINRKVFTTDDLAIQRSYLEKNLYKCVSHLRIEQKMFRIMSALPLNHEPIYFMYELYLFDKKRTILLLVQWYD